MHTYQHWQIVCCTEHTVKQRSSSCSANKTVAMTSNVMQLLVVHAAAPLLDTNCLQLSIAACEEKLHWQCAAVRKAAQHLASSRRLVAAAVEVLHDLPHTAALLV
jgi:hypothetical protein